MRRRCLFLLLCGHCRCRPEVSRMIWREGRDMRAKQQDKHATQREAWYEELGACGEVRGAPVYLGHVAVLSEACDVFQGGRGVTDRAVMWGCLREKLQIIREQREVQGGLVLVAGLVCVACNRNNVQNYKEVLNIFSPPTFATFPWEERSPVLRQNGNHPRVQPVCTAKQPCTPSGSRIELKPFLNQL